MSKQYFPKYHMAGIHDLFPDHLDYSWIKGDGNVIKNYVANSKRHLAIQIWHTFMKKVVEDMVEENLLLLFPKSDAAMMIEEIPDEIFRKLRQEGKLLYISTAFSMGKGYTPVYRYNKKGKNHKFKVVFDNEHFQEMVDNINDGKIYYGHTSIW
jgi:hypothetical protein